MTRALRTTKRQYRSETLTCIHCGYPFPRVAMGTRHHNHCPHCLWSQHLDVLPGDRRCPCHGAMQPIAVWIRNDGELALVHRCVRCSTLGSNRVAGTTTPAC